MENVGFDFGVPLAGSGGFWLWLLLRLFFGTFNVQVGEDVNLFVDGLLVGYGV